MDPTAETGCFAAAPTRLADTDEYQADVAAISQMESVPAILEVICRTTGMRFAVVARVTEDRWIACGVRDEIQFGLRPGDELRIETTICDETRRSQDPVVIDNVATDPTYCHHPTPAMYGFQSYISLPIVLADGSVFGTLCAIDPRPVRLSTPETIGMFKLFAQLIAMHLSASRRLASTEASLQGERATSQLREQSIAVLGHDLRNPLASIDAGAKLLLRTPLNAKATKIVGLMQSSVARMSGLIDDVLDFARGRLGGGMTLDRDANEPLAPILNQVIAEVRAAWPDREVWAKVAIGEPVNCDRGRIGQLVSNLLGNALTYGAADKPVQVHTVTFDGHFELSVANACDPIPPATLQHLFEPFSRGAAGSDRQGLGLGLYIAAEIARAHGGGLSVVSNTDRTCFTFRMKLT